MKKTYIRYIPTALPSLVGNSFDHPFKHWSPDSQFHYPYILFSTALMGDDGLPDEVVENNFIFGDSGGFQEGKPEFAHLLKPEIIIKKQEEYCDAGFILDKPPWKIGRGYDQDWFERCARITKEDGDRMYELQEREDFQLYGVIQGRNREEWDIWYETLTKDHDYDYWSMSPASNPDKINTVIDFGFWAKEKGIKDFHVLGLGRNIFPPVFGYLVNKLDLGSCTLDTSLHHLRWEIFNKNFDGRRSRNKVDFNYPICSCPVCQVFDETRSEEDFYITYYWKAHNVYFNSLLYDMVNCICDVTEDLITLETGCKPYIEKIDNIISGNIKSQSKLEVF